MTSIAARTKLKPEHPIPAGVGALLKPAEAKSAASPTPKTADQPTDKKPDPSMLETQRELPAMLVPPPITDEPWPDATPPPMRPVKPPTRRPNGTSMPASPPRR